MSFRRIIGTMLMLCAVIIPHEFGHFVAAKLTGVGVLRFSFGFGPVVASTWVGETEFCISALPIGGYVELVDVESIETLDKADISTLQKLHPQVWAMLNDRNRYLSEKDPAIAFLVAVTGSAFNFLFVLASMPTLFDLARHKKLSLESFMLLESNKEKQFLGPISLMKMAGRSCNLGLAAAWSLTIRLALGIGIFQLLPLPFLDGGHALSAFLLAFELMLLSGNIYELGAIILIGMATYKLYLHSLFKLQALKQLLSIPRFQLKGVLRDIANSFPFKT